jgi:hypothetical protein
VPVFTAAEQLGQPRLVAVRVFGLLRELNQGPPHVGGVDGERVIGEARLPLFADQLEAFQLREVMRDRRLRHADERDDLGHVQLGHRDQPQNAQPRRVTQGVEGLGEGVHR